MKKLTKRLMGVAMSVAAVCMMGCALTQDGAGAIRNNRINFDNSYVIEKDGNVKHANEGDKNATKNSEYYYRAISQLATKHYAATCKITLTPSKDGEDGVVGFFFGGKENTDWNNESLGDLDCFLVGIQSTHNQLRTYISKYENVSLKDNNYTKNKNLYGKDGKEATTNATGEAAKEIEILKGTNNSTWFELSGISKNDDGTISVVIKLTANENGSYKVDYYKAEDVDNKGNVLQSNNPVKSQDIINAQTGLSKKTQFNMGRYACVYPGKTLIGKWDFLDTEGNVIPVVE